MGGRGRREVRGQGRNKGQLGMGRRQRGMKEKVTREEEGRLTILT